MLAAAHRAHRPAPHRPAPHRPTPHRLQPSKVGPSRGRGLRHDIRLLIPRRRGGDAVARRWQRGGNALGGRAGLVSEGEGRATHRLLSGKVRPSVSRLRGGSGSRQRAPSGLPKICCKFSLAPTSYLRAQGHVSAPPEAGGSGRGRRCLGGVSEVSRRCLGSVLARRIVRVERDTAFEGHRPRRDCKA